jgi:hypothetical protein
MLDRSQRDRPRNGDTRRVPANRARDFFAVHDPRNAFARNFKAREGQRACVVFLESQRDDAKRRSKCPLHSLP